MPVLKILTVPNPILKKKSKKVGKINSEIKKLAKDLKETIRNFGDKHEKGAALSACQVGELKRLFVFRNQDGKLSTLVNPDILKLSKKQVVDMEGCLSIPKIYGAVSRAAKAKVKGLNLRGEKVEISAEGMISRILQHEIDHLNGIIFTERVDDLSKIYRLTKEGKLVREGMVSGSDKDSVIKI
ncbi:MAG: peptide deformylase [Candidatus Aenigmarchaeota archaeon]|nr:peptide deformylase [Candidatus Aenigmarchaeota archaeon]